MFLLLIHLWVFLRRAILLRGFGLGLASHGLGTARAMSRNETAGVFAALALGLNGIATSILVPLLFKLLNLF